MHASDMFQCVVLVKRTNKVLRPRKNDEWNLKNSIRLMRASQPGGGEGRGKGKGTKALKNKVVDGIGGTFLFYGDCSFNEVI